MVTKKERRLRALLAYYSRRFDHLQKTQSEAVKEYFKKRDMVRAQAVRRRLSANSKNSTI